MDAQELLKVVSPPTKPCKLRNNPRFFINPFFISDFYYLTVHEHKLSSAPDDGRQTGAEGQPQGKHPLRFVFSIIQPSQGIQTSTYRNQRRLHPANPKIMSSKAPQRHDDEVDRQSVRSKVGNVLWLCW